MLFRPASQKDIDLIYDIYMDPSANPYLTFDVMDKGSFTPIFEEIIRSRTLFVAEVGGEIVGTYRLVTKQYREEDTVYIGSFAIRAGFTGKGMGKSMLRHIKEWALAAGKVRLELTVAINNREAISLYEKMGFVTEGIKRKNYKLDGKREYFDEFMMAYVFES